MTKKFFSGNSIEQAVLTAARHFQLEPQDVDYREVERRHGFLRVRRRAVISVDPESPRKTGDDRQPQAEPAAAAVAEPKVAAGGHQDIEPAPVDTSEEPSATDRGEPFGSWQREDEGEADRQSSGIQVEDFWPEDEEPEAPAESRPEPEIPQTADLIEAAEEALRRLFALGDLNLNAEVEEGEERIEVELRGEDEERLLEDRGRLLLAIQHLLPRMLRGLTGRSAPCWVDCDNFHEIRAEQLRDLAQQVASQVRRERQMQVLEPMSPDERRIVHVTLSDDPAVETVSRGQGLFKRVQVRPVRLRPKGFDPYNR